MGGRDGIEGEGVVNRAVKPFGSGGAHVTAPKDWLGPEVTLARTTSPENADE